jgi:uncharacterized membrane protein
MERMLVALFNDEAKAREGSQALQVMGDDGVVAVHTVRIFTRDQDGIVASDDIYDALPEGTMGGTAVGSLLGLLGGPVGLAIGAVGGLLVGATADYAKSRVTTDFAQQVADELTPGKAAIVAEVDEEEPEAVNDRLQALGARLLRRDLSDVADREYEHEMAGIKSDLARVKAKLSARTARLHAKTDSVVQKIERKLARD